MTQRETARHEVENCGRNRASVDVGWSSDLLQTLSDDPTKGQATAPYIAVHLGVGGEALQ